MGAWGPGFVQFLGLGLRALGRWTSQGFRVASGAGLGRSVKSIRVQDAMDTESRRCSSIGSQKKPARKNSQSSLSPRLRTIRALLIKGHLAGPGFKGF